MAGSRLPVFFLPLALTVTFAHVTPAAAAVLAAPLEVPGLARLTLPEGLMQTEGLALARLSVPRVTVRPGERLLGAVRVTGRVPLASSRSAYAEGEVRFATSARLTHACVVVRTGAGPLRLAAYEPRSRIEDGAVVAPVPLPTWLSGPVEAYLVDTSSSIEQVTVPELEADPLDTAPCGTRRPLILIHGKDNHDLTEATHHEAKRETFAKLRAAPGYKSLFLRFKPYFYLYPSYRSPVENGAALARLVRERFGARPGLVAVAHSMGGLVLRRALSEPGFFAATALGITSSSPHHGALASSLIFANGRLSEKLGSLATLLIRFGSSGEPDTPGLRAVAWDGADGSITAADEARYGVLVNRELAAFNAGWTAHAKLVTVMGDVTSLVGHGPVFGVKDEAYRRVQAAWAPKFGNCDPMVCFASGTFEGAPVAGRVVFEGFDHRQIIGHPTAIAAILELVRGAAVDEGA